MAPYGQRAAPFGPEVMAGQAEPLDPFYLVVEGTTDEVDVGVAEDSGTGDCSAVTEGLGAIEEVAGGALICGSSGATGVSVGFCGIGATAGPVGALICGWGSSYGTSFAMESLIRLTASGSLDWAPRAFGWFSLFAVIGDYLVAKPQRILMK